MNDKTLTLDIHGMTEAEAKKYLLRRIEQAPKNVGQIIVIHGCNNGTVLRDMVRTKIKSSRIYEIAPTFLNDGQTTIYLKKG